MTDPPVFDPHDLEEAISQVDLCFVIDSTGSMAHLIDEARRTASAEAERVAAGGLDLQYALVAYRDHPPQDSSFVTQVFPFGSRLQFDRALGLLSANGGGDGPEAVYDGLVAAGNLQWRPTADHLVFLIGDAPPHGVGAHGDSWPKGCPCGMRAGGVIELYDFHHIRLNAVSIAGDPQTTAAFREVAKGCRGDCVEADTPAAAVGATVSTVSDTAGLVGDRHAVGSASHYAITMSSTPGMTDEAYATASASPMAHVKGLRGYLKHRGFDIPTGASPSSAIPEPPGSTDGS